MSIKQRIIAKDKVDTSNWSSWSCEPSTFDWEYNEDETAYVFEGKVIVKTPNEEVEVRGGSLVQFPKGLKYTWNVIEPIRKVYTFQNFN